MNEPDASGKLVTHLIESEITANVLTEGHADDAAQVPALLGQAEGVIASVTAYGAYDGEPTWASAVPSSDKDDSHPQDPGDRHIQLRAAHGRMGWQKTTGYGRRSQGETAMARYKHLIGPKLRARSLPAQQGEAAVAAAVLNTMIQTAKPVSVRAA